MMATMALNLPEARKTRRLAVVGLLLSDLQIETSSEAPIALPFISHVGVELVLNQTSRLETASFPLLALQPPLALQLEQGSRGAKSLP